MPLLAGGMHLLRYERGGLIQERENLRSGWDVYLLTLPNVCVGRVESYWQGSAVLWRSLDHWLCDHRQGFASRDAAAQDLLETCPRTRELVKRSAERHGVAAGRRRA